MGKKFEVVVGGVGYFPASSLPEAEAAYKRYVAESIAGVGEAAGAFVTLNVDGQPLLQHWGDLEEGDSE